jgi:putative endonuclease
MNPDGILYKGNTSDLLQRLEQHNCDDGFPSYTHKRGPWKLLYQERFKNKEEALAREKFFKTGKGREYLNAVVRRLSAQADG